MKALLLGFVVSSAQVLALVLVPHGLAVAADNPRCAAKAASLRQEIQTAKSAGHDHKAHGMETALAELQANCTDAGLLADQRKAVTEARAEVKEREAELAEEKADGDDAGKIAKRQAKLDEAKAELKQAEAELAR